MSKPVMQLSADVFRQLHDLCESPIASVYRNARIVLSAADGMAVRDIARAFGISARSVKSTIQTFRVGGVESLMCRGAAGRPSGLTSEQRQAIIDLFRYCPSKFGIDKARWTAADIATVAQREQIADQISPATIRRMVLDAGLDWHTAKGLCQGKRDVGGVSLTEDESADSVAVDDRMSLLEVWISACAKNEVERERLTSIYSTLLRRYGSRDGDNHLQIELLATHLLNVLRAQEAGDREAIDKVLMIVRGHLEELERGAALRQKSAGPPPGTTPAEVASELLKRWQRAQNEERNG